MNYKITERQLNRRWLNLIGENRHLITEGAETKNMRAAKHYLYDKMGYDEQSAMKTIGAIKTDVPNSRLAKCKFMLALTRMWANGELSDGRTIANINKVLKYAASDAHVNEYNQDLNGLSAEQLVDRFSGNAQQDLDNDKEEVSSQQYEDTGKYTIVKIHNFDEASEYYDYTSWCVTGDESMYNSYTAGGTGVFYFCLMDGYEDMDAQVGENCPLDEWGLSMIAVSINEDGSCNTITCRWNHDQGGNDHVMTPKQLSEVIGRNFYEVFKPLTKEEIERNLTERIRSIEDEIMDKFDRGWGSMEDMCGSMGEYPDDYSKDGNNYYLYRPDDGDGVVVTDEDGSLVSNRVFDNVSSRYGDYFTVELQPGKYNVMTTDGRFIGPATYSKVFPEMECCHGARVMLNNRWNYLRPDGTYILDNWAVSCDMFKLTRKHTPVQVEKGVTNFVDTQGNFVFKEGFSRYYCCEYGAFVEFDGTYYLYDLDTGKQKAPWKIKSLQGYQGKSVNGGYVSFYHVKLIDGRDVMLDLDANMYDFRSGKLIEKNPYANAVKSEARIARLADKALYEAAQQILHRKSQRNAILT